MTTNTIRTAEGGAEAEDDGDADIEDAGTDDGQDGGARDAADDGSGDGDAAVEVQLADAGEGADATQVTEQPRCGNGVVDPGEECDQGDQNSDTQPGACRANCHLARCGDGVTDPSEACDDGEGNSNGEPDACRVDCSAPRCGDGVIDDGEQCDTGEARSDSVPGACRTDCRAAHCGDTVVDPDESCDDGNDVDTDACRNTCVSARCGDRVVDPEEQCDDGNTQSGDGCQATCRLPICGDRVVDPGEQCDDGNTADNDGCRSTCETGCTADSACSDGRYCNGTERCLNGVCSPAAGGPSLDDGVDCTLDACDEQNDRVTHTPVDAMCSADGPSCSAATATSQTATCDASRGCVVRTTTQSCADSPSSCARFGDGSFVLTTYVPACDPQSSTCGPPAAATQRCTSAAASCSVGRVHTGVAAATCDPNSESCGRMAPSVEDCSARDSSRCAADDTSFTQVRGTCDATNGCGSSTTTTACANPADACSAGRLRTFAPSCDDARGCQAATQTGDTACPAADPECAPNGNGVATLTTYTPACASGTSCAPKGAATSRACPRRTTCANPGGRQPDSLTTWAPACADGKSCATTGEAQAPVPCGINPTRCATENGRAVVLSYTPRCQDATSCVPGGEEAQSYCDEQPTSCGPNNTAIDYINQCSGTACATSVSTCPSDVRWFCASSTRREQRQGVCRFGTGCTYVYNGGQVETCRAPVCQSLDGVEMSCGGCTTVNGVPSCSTGCVRCTSGCNQSLGTCNLIRLPPGSIAGGVLGGVIGNAVGAGN